MKPYADDAPVDWMNVSASDVLDRLLPVGWRDRSYGDLVRASPTDWLGWMYPQYGAGAPYPGAPQYHSDGRYAGPQRHGPTAATALPKHALYEVPRPGRHYPPHPHGCRCPVCCEAERCRRCGPDPCECFCCIGEVDFVLYARVGEQRVIPVAVENERRREKDITVELSPWRTRGGGGGPVETLTVEPKTFKLPPCGEKEVVIAVRVREPAATGSQTPASPPATNERIPEREIKDVDECLVVTADLTLVGCDHRPIRIAIAILPRDCDPFKVTCGCTCW